ncbi:A1S_2505 family phage non-structural protein [Agrococcus sp. TSP3-2-1]|uniref:A1S_2505 family phage non-structural protein n=1 Tax=Agrococcus sp. TSP3-2-1 TaxID=2804583 RepID=UPI003CF179BE
MRTSPNRVESLEPQQVFVFGSNAEGMHGAGAARTAVERFGAVWGEGHGLHGQSYAIDRMSGLGVIEREVATFLGFAAEHPELEFLVTEIGCGIAGFTPEEIAPLFRGAGDNVLLPERFAAVVERGAD